jgi:hypothetical protein
LIRIDKSTGAGVVVGPIGFTNVSGLGARALQMATPGVLYATTGGDVGLLLRIHPVSGAGTLIGDTGLPGAPGLAIDPLGQIFCTSRSFPMATPSDLYRVDAATAQSFRVGSTGVGFMDAIAFDFFGGLWGLASEDENLYRVDPATAATTLVGFTGEQLAGAAFDPISGSLFASTGGNVPSNPDALYRVDTTNGALTLVGTSGLGGAIPDIQFDGSGLLLGVKAGNLIAIDRETAEGTLIGPTGFNPVSGLAAIPGRSLLDAPSAAVATATIALLPAMPNPMSEHTG